MWLIIIIKTKKGMCYYGRICYYRQVFACTSVLWTLPTYFYKRGSTPCILCTKSLLSNKDYKFPLPCGFSLHKARFPHKSRVYLFIVARLLIFFVTNSTYDYLGVIENFVACDVNSIQFNRICQWECALSSFFTIQKGSITRRENKHISYSVNF